MADNTQNTGSSKKKKIVTAAIAVALAALLLIGGTFSYLQDDSVAVVNEFNGNGVFVELSEDSAEDTDGDGNYDFDIVPGTSDTKDPEVTVTTTLDTYVFLLVDDDTNGLVEYVIADGWTLLYSEDDSDNPCTGYAVYTKYIDVDATDDDGNNLYTLGSNGYYTVSIQVLENDTVTYSASLTNDSLGNTETTTTATDDDGNTVSTTTYTLGDSVTLTFVAYAIQASPFATKEEYVEADAKMALEAAYNGTIFGTEAYSSGTDTVIPLTVNTTVANSETDDDGNATTTSTTFTLTIPSATTIASASSSDDSESDDSSSDSDDSDSDDDSDDDEDTEDSSTPTSLTLSVTETTADTVAVVPDGDAGDYTYEISLVDQDGNSVSATSGYMNVAIQIKTGITASNLTVTKLGDNDTTLSTTTSTDNSDYYSYNSDTGILTIYTQSLGEYEISWNDTAISMKEITDELLTFTGKNSKTYTMDIGWMYYTDAESINDAYSSWNINIAILPDNDMSDATIHYTSDIYKYSSSLYLYYTYGVLNGRPSDILTAGSDYCLFSGDYIYPASYLVASEEGVSLFDYNFRVGLKGCPSGTGTVELRLYETDDEGKETGKYITLQTLSFEVTDSE